MTITRAATRLTRAGADAGRAALAAIGADDQRP